ncbi:MAG: hypothetical protein O8C66_06680 [Candidatus Methanoperedens sp.]|nr:hypothetical protein [Candidatus Methanoperedens sp.]MCZ7370177.1 hypothetical protein [Candidatus Methanoperedens sp.]
MWERKVSRKTTAKKEQIWKLWSDVTHWKTWDEELEYSELFGDFKTGTKGVLKPIAGPETKFVITSCDYLAGFSDRSFLPLCKMDFIHMLKETNGGLEITHKVQITGALTFLFSKKIGKKVEAGLPKSVEKLIELAEKGD